MCPSGALRLPAVIVYVYKVQCVSVGRAWVVRGPGERPDQHRKDHRKDRRKDHIIGDSATNGGDGNRDSDSRSGSWEDENLSRLIWRMTATVRFFYHFLTDHSTLAVTSCRGSGVTSCSRDT